ncbi:MAG: hypothetical protein ACT4RN_01430 [Pseudonocardia sp.]
MTRGRAATATGTDAYRLVRQILDPVVAPGFSHGSGAVRTWAERVERAGDERHIYLLLQAWWLVAGDPGLKEEIHAYITAIWLRTDRGRRRLRGFRWGAAGLLGVGAVWWAASSWGLLGALGVAVAVALLAILGMFVVVGRGLNKIAQYFPDLADQVRRGELRS